MVEVSAAPKRRASTSRRSAARRTPSTPTRSSPSLLADGLVPADRRRRRRPRRRQHVRVHRGGPPGVDRRRARAGRRASAPAPSSWSPAAWPSATATSSPPRCPKPTRSSGSRARASLRRASVLEAASRPVCATCWSCPRPAPSAPWAYVKIAEGCDRACAFCAIPSFRGTQRSRTPESIEAEARALVEQGVAEIVLVAQDLAWYGRDAGEPGSLAPLLRRLDALAPARPGAHPPALPLPVRGPRPARRDDARAADGRARTSTCRCSTRRRRLLRRMKRWGSGDRFLADDRRHPRRAARRRVPVVVHRRLPRRDRARSRRSCSRSSPTRALDWAGFFPFSHEDGTAARSTLDGVVDAAARARAPARVRGGAGSDHRTRRAHALVGETVEVLVDGSTTTTVSSAAPTAKRRRSTVSSASWRPAGTCPPGRDRGGARSPARSVPTWRRRPLHA